ncbi:TadE/TadG family type IV pilus assembly protein [Gulosibacter sediminis]|uniref:TadE/TadG family type IV pilus assembly protein n=1 Tax=Gulosibacter sediminis TaxID=1729695 RepID=UPI0024AE3212|nr:hypothetical protein [Gulosibacter sediminis]
MHRWNDLVQRLGQRLGDERGSASLEFLGVGVLLLVPVAYGTLTLGQAEQAMLGSELGARNAARVLAADGIDQLSLANHHITIALENHGLDPELASVDVRCAPTPDCTVAGETLTVTVRYELELPLMFGTSDLLSIPVEASSTFPQQRFATGE